MSDTVDELRARRSARWRRWADVEVEAEEGAAAEAGAAVIMGTGTADVPADGVVALVGAAGLCVCVRVPPCVAALSCGRCGCGFRDLDGWVVRGGTEPEESDGVWSRSPMVEISSPSSPSVGTRSVSQAGCRDMTSGGQA